MRGKIMWPFRKSDKPTQQHDPAREFAEAVMQNAVRSFGNHIKVEVFLAIFDKLPDTKGKDHEEKGVVLCSAAITATVALCARLSEKKIADLTPPELLSLFTKTTAMCDHLSRMTNAHFEATTLFSHAMYLPYFIGRSERHIDGTEQLDDMAYAVRFGQLANDNYGKLVQSDKGREWCKRPALLAWRWIGNMEKDALMELAEVLFPSAKKPA
ncbi:MAG: hypothetical protein ACRDBH_03110 [Bosea sp. (in: a-proteobacteria)]